ncbi:MAG: fumarylacetoacetate hydrolase family protein [Halobacteriovoraceae bacterium]|jgi:2-keto-4-pentenoate hydratase/2-oxohepta-3-ene-1,7-dioic acid hydratase in catechol pathway|nr:fumarylacetoacetate hydrolase family protein [Halobacteriovoraceae bacterium]
MKICHYRSSTLFSPHSRMGILTDGGEIIDPALVWSAEFEKRGHHNHLERGEHRNPSSLYNYLRISRNPIEELQETLELYKKLAVDQQVHPLSFKGDLKLDSPLDKINCYRDFYAHEKHVAVGFKKRNEPIPEAWYQIPAYYKGATTGFIGNQDEVLWPSYTDILDYELELGLVVGRDGYNLNQKEANKHIFGFTILNDISARDIQKKEMAVRLGPAKGKDFCSVLGPVITTYDEFNFKEPNLKMTATINGEKWSEGQSGEAQFSWAEMLEHVSKDEWLLATDLLGSGTVGTGCGLELDKWIKPGDKIELEVEKIGTLSNTIGNKKK